MSSDQYRVDLDSVSALTQSWQSAARTADDVSRQLAAVHRRLEQAVPRGLIAGLAGEVPLLAAFAALATAATEANALAQGLAQDVAALARNHANYAKTEAEITAKLKAEEAQRAKAKHATSPHGGATTTSGAGSAHRSPGGSGGSGGGGSAGSHGGGFSGSGGSSDGSGSGGSDSGGSSSGGSGWGGSGSGGSDSGGSSADGSSGSSAGSNPPPGPAHYANAEQVNQWIDQAFEVLEAHGVPASELDRAGVLTIIEHESSGNPNAINNWDSNAQAGDPSRGLMQTIGATFDAYQLPGHGDIYNPVDNIIAGVRYALSRYGSIQNVPGVKSVENGGSYVGY